MKILKPYEIIDFFGNFGNFEFFSKFGESLNIFFFNFRILKFSKYFEILCNFLILIN